MRIRSDIISGGVGHRPGKHTLESGHGLRTCVKRQRIFAVPAEGSQFIEACDMIKVAMSVENRINFPQALSEGLLAEVGTTIDQNRTSGCLQVERGPGSLVSRVAGGAYRARAPNDWHPH